jgi:hypothetical protein
MVPDRLKKIIFRKLYDDLSHVEIISFRNSIWFIDREEKFWYFELQSDGTLWWRYQFFSDFFILFSLERDDYQSILARWVEEVLNSRVYITDFYEHQPTRKVEEVLNSRVIKTSEHYFKESETVEEVLNLRVDTTGPLSMWCTVSVEEVLNSRVNTTVAMNFRQEPTVEEVLNSKVNTTHFGASVCADQVEEVLNCGDSAPTFDERLSHKVSQAKEGELFDETIVDTVLSSFQSF